MKNALLILFIACSLQSALAFLWDRPGGGQFGTRFPTTTIINPTRTTRTTTTQPRPCRYRGWGKCTSGHSSTRTKQPLPGYSHCAPVTEACSIGAQMGATFISSLSTPGQTVSVRPVSQPGDSRVHVVGSTSTLANRGNGAAVPRNRSAAIEQILTQATAVRQCAGDQRMGNCNPVGAGRKRRQVSSGFPIVQTKRDVLMLLDESGSVGYRRFHSKVKRIAAAIVEVLCNDIAVAPHKTRVAVTSFDQITHDHIRLKDFYPSPAALAGYIRSPYNIRYSYYTSRRTCLVDALIHAYVEMSATINGGRQSQNNVEQDIILITDGCANCHHYGVSTEQVLQNLADFFVQQGMHIYVIGVGLQHACRQKLRILAQGGRCYHFFFLDRWNYEVNDFIQQLEFPPANQCLQLFESPTQLCIPGSGK
uniref:ASP-1 n=1 Tax=Ciona intestinalis TaxID=7719 RepID=A0A481P895_CIOIN|nr:ASP-1 [Ciona intestinalis]